LFAGFESSLTLCSLSKAWLVRFNYVDDGLYKRLSRLTGKLHFGFAQRQIANLNPAMYCYLNTWGVGHCRHCGMYTGTVEEGVPLSPFTEKNGIYVCINPACGKPLNLRINDVELSKVFSLCEKSHPSKQHTWKVQLDTKEDDENMDLCLPNGQQIHEEYIPCKRCGLLKENRHYVESSFCQLCMHDKEKCRKFSETKYLQLRRTAQTLEKRYMKDARARSRDVKFMKKYDAYKKYLSLGTCMPCNLCRRERENCKCEICTECKRCTGCDNCPEGDEKICCDCILCDDCDGLVSCSKRKILMANKCECDSSADGSLEELF